MNICMFTNTYTPHVGGVARSVACFEADLRRLGHRVLVVAPTYPGMPSDETEDHVLRVPAIQNFNGSDFSARIPLPFLVSRKIDAFSPDIIHSHHPYLMGETALRVAGSRHLPLVFTYHTLYEEYVHYVLQSKSMQRYIIRFATAYANFCTSVVAPSDSVAELIRQRGVDVPIEVIPTGIDFEAFQQGDGALFRKKTGIGENVPLIGHVGRLAPEKNLVFLSLAVKRHMRENTETRFLIVGDGPDLKQIQAAFDRENMGDRLVLTGKLTGEDLINAYCAMDVFVFSSHSETQGLVIAEAMAAGAPVIALDASGVRDVVSDNENGRLLPSDASAEAFANTISAFFSDPDQGRAWHDNALETARRFDRLAMAEQLSQLYSKTLQKPLKSGAEYDSMLGPWENLLDGIKVEWDLLSSKVSAIAESIGFEEI